MKKRVLLFLLSVLLLQGGFALPAKAEDAPVAIDSREGMEAIAQNPAGNYCITADIDMDGTPWTPIPFSGTLDGQGHTLYNLRVREPGAEVVGTFDGNRKTYDTVFGALFSTVTDATVKNLALVNADVAVTTEQNCFLAPLAGYALRSAFENCSAASRVTLTLSGTNEGVGGLIGFSDACTVENCSADCVLTFTDTNPAIDCEEFMGGIIACGSGRVNGCTVKLRGFAEIYGYAHGGGVFGMQKIRRGLDFYPRVQRTTVDVEIAFFEVAPSKRSYCDPLIGEDSGGYCAVSRNTVAHFEKYASRKAERLRPEACASPDEAVTVTEPTCTAWGYTTHTCRVCGYTYTDDYTPPAHRYEAVETTAPTCTEAGETAYTCVFCGDSYAEPIPPKGHTPGEWTTVREAAVGAAGEEQIRCAACGTVLESREIPALTAGDVSETPKPDAPGSAKERLTLLPEAVSLHVGKSAALTVSPAPAIAAFSSDDASVASVSPEGVVTANAPGTTVIRCTGDGQSAAATVTVSYTAGQWIVHYILFGWLWDR